MVISRRAFINTTFAGVAGAGLARFDLVSAESRPQYLAGCQKDYKGNYCLTIAYSDGEILHEIPLSGRGHAPVFDRNARRCVMVARRPGDWIKIVELDQPENPLTIACPPNRRFCGHAVFSADEQLLFATENDFERGAGVVGVYDLADSAKRIGELDTYGVGPHELMLMPDGMSLVIANGGILTHPDRAREKLNLETMSPSLVVVQIADGQLLEEHRLPEDLYQLGIRHIDVSKNGTIVAAMQFEGPQSLSPALLAVRQSGKPLVLLPAPDEIAAITKNYAGSVKLDSSGRWAAVSCPRAGHVQLFDIQAAEYLHKIDVVDGCGLARGESPGEFIISNGLGDLLQVQATNGAKYPDLLSMQPGFGWDNHLASYFAV